MKLEAEILLVEDTASDRELALRALRKANFLNKVYVAKDGEEALDFVFCRGEYAHRLGRRPPGVILLDLKLPKVDGLEVLKRLKSDPKTQSIPVVMLTSSRENRDVAECYKYGVNSYIVKPVDFEQFSSALSSLGIYWLALNVLPPDKCLEGKAVNEGGCFQK